MSTLKLHGLLPVFLLLFSTCGNKPEPWNGPQLTTERNQLTVVQLQENGIDEFIDLSYFTQPDWAQEAVHDFSGSITFTDTELHYPKGRDYYEGEDLFPGINLNFLSHEGELIPIQRQVFSAQQGSESFWDVIVGTGKVWQEAGDGKWSRASFPLTLADRYVGQARNCVATFVYQTDIISKVCVQCSQETADFGNHDAGNIRVTLAAKYQPKLYADSTEVVEQQEQLKAARLPTHPLKEIDADGEVAAYFDDALLTNASTSQGAVWINEKLYVHPPNTRHGAYPYPQEMRHGVYSVTKSMAGALALFYLAERYGDELFDALVTDYVPVLADHSGWQGVTLSQTLSMVSGTVGSDEAEHLLNVLIIARTAEESINNIAKLGDAPDAPGERFNYQSTNLFVLSYALQNYVAAKEGSDVNYWDLVHEGVLVPMGAENFTLRRTIETDGRKGLPILAYGAYPTLDEAAKISLLFINEGRYKGQQLLSKERVRTIFGRAATGGYSTNNDYRGTGYQDSFWSKRIRTRSGKVLVSYMLGYGTNYVLFWSGDTFVIRFMDEFDLDVDKLVREVDKLRIATTSD